jgi:hypothetical protein
MMTTFLATTLATAAIAFLTQATAAIVPPSTVEVPQWSTYEMTLTAKDAHNTPASVDLTGVFSGPDGLAYEIKGFWDGGSTFRIRFTPTVEGLWTFMTVSDDSGLDGQLGSIHVVAGAPATHGFVRQKADDIASWQYDDGTTAGKALTVLPILDRLDVAGLRAVDRLVADARSAGRVAGIVLFKGNDASSANFTKAQLHEYVQYVAARYGSFTNVVWCLHPPASATEGEAFWQLAGEMTAALDPYFAADADHARVLLDACTPNESRQPAESSVQPSYGTMPSGGRIVLAAQTFPNPVQTNAVEGIVRKSDAAAGAVVVRAADGVEHLMHVTKDTVSHGKPAAVDIFDGLKEGSHVIVHYATDEGEKTAVEVDHIGGEGLTMIEARVTHIDRAKKQLTIKLADGSKQTLRLTERAAAEADDAATEAAKVAVYYTNEAGERVVHCFKQIR